MRLSLPYVMVATTAVLLSTAVSVFAESAPVFDADSMQQQFESDTGQTTPQDISPATSENANTFAPMDSSPSSSTASSSGSGGVSSGGLDKRVRRMEQQLNNLQNGEGNAHVESLQNQVQSLRGQVEQLTHQLQQLQNQQKTLLADSSSEPHKEAAGASVSDSSHADTTEAAPTTAKAAKIAAAKESIKATAGVSAAAGIEKKPAAADQPNTAEEQQIYQTAYNLIKAKKYNEAVDALQSMLKKYPSGQFASNAHYWLGELYGLMGKNDLALKEFETVVASYNESPRVPDAQLKVGLIYSAQSKWPDAKSTFKKVLSKYPGTASARVASDQLRQIKSAGH